MAAEWLEAPSHIVELVKKTIDDHHPMLREARIAVVLRGDLPMTKGKIVYGKAEKVNDKWKLILKQRYDFLIWFSDDGWRMLNPAQQRALVDHELCHCLFDGTAAIRGHDIEEFVEIVERHGLWHPELAQFGEAVKDAPLALFDFKPAGAVDAVTIETAVGKLFHGVDRDGDPMKREVTREVDQDTGEIIESPGPPEVVLKSFGDVE